VDILIGLLVWVGFTKEKSWNLGELEHGSDHWCSSHGKIFLDRLFLSWENATSWRLACVIEHGLDHGCSGIEWQVVLQLSVSR
jgi:hypothetical protein